MTTIPRGFWARRTDNEPTTSQPDMSTTTHNHSSQHTAADSITLRGIPAIGRGVAGHITGTNPALQWQWATATF